MVYAIWDLTYLKDYVYYILLICSMTSFHVLHDYVISFIRYLLLWYVIVIIVIYNIILIFNSKFKNKKRKAKLRSNNKF